MHFKQLDKVRHFMNILYYCHVQASCSMHSPAGNFSARLFLILFIHLLQRKQISVFLFIIDPLSESMKAVFTMVDVTEPTTVSVSS